MIKKILASVGILGMSAAAFAVVPFLNQPDTQYPWVGQIRGASGVVIAPHWVLSAKHVASDGGTFAVGGLQYFPDYWINADGVAGRPATDLTLLHFPTVFPSYCVPYYGNVVGMIATMVGWGISGTERPDGTGYITDGNSGGIRRAGKNKISKLELIPDFIGDQVWALWYDLDGNGYDTWGDGGPIAGQIEATLGVGDSGGGMFVQIGGESRLIGICAFIDDEIDPFNPPSSPDPYYDYGDAGGGTALSVYKDWIQSTIGGPFVNPSSVQINHGTQGGGTLASFFASDDNRFGVQADELDPNPQLTLIGTSPTQAASQIYFHVETRASRSDMIQVVELYNYSNSNWDTVARWTKSATLSDSSDIYLAKTNLTQLIRQSTREMQARMTWIPISESTAFDGWASYVDQAVWQVAP